MLDLVELNRKADKWQILQDDAETRKVAADEDINQKTLEVQDLKAAVGLLQFVSAELNRETEAQTAALVTMALKETFPDQDLALLVEHETYRGQPGVKFLLKDETTGISGDPMSAFGGGPASLLGILLQVISTVRQPGMARVLILDEPMAQISSSYGPLAGRLLRKICAAEPRGLAFKMLVVTHMDSIAEAAHKRYLAKNENGVLSLEEVDSEEEINHV